MGTSITYGFFGDPVWGPQAEFVEALAGAHRPPGQVQIPVLGGVIGGSGGGPRGRGVWRPWPGGGLGGPSGRSFEPNTRVVHFFGGSVRASLACVLNGTNKKSPKNNGHHEIAGHK